MYYHVKHNMSRQCNIQWNVPSLNRNIPIPEMLSMSFSSFTARDVLVMSMDETDRSSLSAMSEGSEFMIATSESEKPWKINTNTDVSITVIWGRRYE